MTRPIRRASRLLPALATMLCVATLAVAPDPASAQSSRYAPLVLQLPASPRGGAMGDAYITSREPDLLFSDAAQLALAPSRGMSASFGRFGSSATSAAISSVGALGGAGGIGVGVRWLGYDGPLETAPIPVRALGARSPLASSSLAATIGGATVVRDVRFGMALNYAADARGGARGGSASADLSVASEVGLRRRVTVALVAQNLGKGISLGGERAPMPRRISLAAGTHAFQAGPVDLGGEAAVSLLRDGSLSPALGGEATYGWLDGYDVTARAGIRRADRVGAEVAHAAGSVGAGISADRLSVDYSYSTEAGVVVHRVGLRLR